MGKKIYRKFKQGKYSPRYPRKYKGSTPIIYRSGLELKLMRWLDRNSLVREWGSESVIIPYVHPKDNRTHRYFVDFNFKMERNGKLKKYLVEVKPSRQSKPPRKTKNTKSYLYESFTYAVNSAKWSAAEKWCKKHGYEFLIITEKHLNNEK